MRSKDRSRTHDQKCSAVWSYDKNISTLGQKRTYTELQIPDEFPAVNFQDDIESTEMFEVDDNNEQNMMVPENNAIECEWQIVKNENIVVNNLEGIEIVVDLQPRDNQSYTDEWSILLNQVDGLQASP